jgi:hypothetical protein
MSRERNASGSMRWLANILFKLLVHCAEGLANLVCQFAQNP